MYLIGQRYKVVTAERQERMIGSLRAQLDTGGGVVVADFQITRVNLAVPSIPSISVEEDFLVVPTLTAGLIILGMTFLQSNCGDASGTARQSQELVTLHSLFTLSWQRTTVGLHMDVGGSVSVIFQMAH